MRRAHQEQNMWRQLEGKDLSIQDVLLHGLRSPGTEKPTADNLKLKGIDFNIGNTVMRKVHLRQSAVTQAGKP